MKIKLKRNQYYVGVENGCHFGKKGEIVNVDPLFVKLIKGAYEVVAEDKEQVPEKKPLEKMNKEELVAETRRVGIELADEDIEK